MIRQKKTDCAYFLVVRLAFRVTFCDVSLRTVLLLAEDLVDFVGLLDLEVDAGLVFLVAFLAVEVLLVEVDLLFVLVFFVAFAAFLGADFFVAVFLEAEVLLTGLLAAFCSLFLVSRLVPLVGVEAVFDSAVFFGFEVDFLGVAFVSALDVDLVAFLEADFVAALVVVLVDLVAFLGVVFVSAFGVVLVDLVAFLDAVFVGVDLAVLFLGVAFVAVFLGAALASDFDVALESAPEVDFAGLLAFLGSFWVSFLVPG